MTERIFVRAAGPGYWPASCSLLPASCWALQAMWLTRSAASTCRAHRSFLQRRARLRRCRAALASSRRAGCSGPAACRGRGRLARVRGQVAVLARVEADGNVSRAELMRSSGFCPYDVQALAGCAAVEIPAGATHGRGPSRSGSPFWSIMLGHRRWRRRALPTPQWREYPTAAAGLHERN